MSASGVADRREVTGYPADPSGRSMTGLGAVVVIAGFSAVGFLIDVFTGAGLRLAFAVALVVGSVVAAVMVRRADLLYVVFAPPLVYLVASMIDLFTSGGGASSLLDAAAGWLVYGFPGIAIATGAAVIVTLIRVARRDPPF